MAIGIFVLYKIRNVAIPVRNTLVKFIRRKKSIARYQREVLKLSDYPRIPNFPFLK